MPHNEIIAKLNAIINTLNAATLRADQIDAIQRINACTQELHVIMKAMEAKPVGKEGDAV